LLFSTYVQNFNAIAGKADPKIKVVTDRKEGMFFDIITPQITSDKLKKKTIFN
jgi:hypothetical protein